MKKLVAAFAASLALQAAHAAADFQYYVFPVGSLTGLDGAGADPAQARVGSMIDEAFAQRIFTPQVQKDFVASFRREVEQRFPGAVVGANQVQSARSGRYAYQPFDAARCSPQFTASYRDAFALALGVSRLSVYVNRYGNYVDVLVPVTYTIRFVKLQGADVVFSRSETIYTTYTGKAADVLVAGGNELAQAPLATLQKAVIEDGQRMVARQVEAAAKGFTPKVSEVAVVARDGDYFVFDHGSEAGFSSNEEFEAVDDQGQELSFTVLYATGGTAVAVASNFTPDVKRTTDRVRAGEKLRFAFTKQGRDDAKPSVLALQYVPATGERLSDDQVRSNALMTLVADDIGFQAPFNLVKHDADFARMKTQIRSEANCDSGMFRTMHGFADNTTVPRALPDFFLRLDAYGSPVFTTWGVGKVNSRSTFADVVALSLVDRSGSVGQVFLGNSPYELVRSADRGLSLGQAGEVNRKNASLLAMKSLVAGFSSTPRTVPLRNVGASTAAVDQPLEPSSLAGARLLRPIKAGGKQVLMPLPADVAQVVPPTQAGTTVQFRGTVKPGDLLQLAAADDGRRTLQRCEATRQGRYLTAPLKSASSLEPAIGRVVFARAKGYRLLEADPVFLEAARRTLVDGQFERWELPAPAATACYLPMELQQLTRNECAGDGCAGTASVASGIRIFEGQNKVGESVAGAKLDFKDIAPDALSDFIGVKAFEQQFNSISTHGTKFN